MKLKKWMIALLTLTIVCGMLAGCGSTKGIAYMKGAETYEESGYYANYDMADSVSMEAPAAMSSRSAKTSAAGSIELPQNRKWVITMHVESETDDLDAALEAVNSQIRTLGGYVESQSINNSTSYRRSRNASLTVRIPADQVDTFVSEVSGITNVVSSSRNVRDITLSYTDTEGRVNALKTEEQRLLELMEKAEDMSDLLVIEERLTEVRYQLESYASQLRLYDNQVDYASVDLYISEVVKYTPVEEPSFWERITSGLADSIVDLGESIVGLIAWIIVDLPYLVVWGLVIWGAVAIVKRSIRKHNAKKAAKKAENQENTK